MSERILGVFEPGREVEAYRVVVFGCFAMTPQQFIAKWKATALSERSACQQHFLDLCELLGQPKPAEVDPTGEWYTFERGVNKSDGGKGFADVWMQGKFGWEYKGKHKNLGAAYQQLLLYREALENPPLLVDCDLDRFEIHTNFTGTVKKVHAFDLDGLADPANIKLLRCVFTAPDELKPGQTQAGVTKEIADRFAHLADGMSRRGIAPQQAAHFLMKLMFCMFAEDIDLLPRDLFARTVANAKNDPKRLSKLLKSLFDSMAKGEPFGADPIAWFNGGLFADSETIDLTPDEVTELLQAARADWSSSSREVKGMVEPSFTFESSCNAAVSDALFPEAAKASGTPVTSGWNVVALIVEPSDLNCPLDCCSACDFDSTALFPSFRDYQPSRNLHEIITSSSRVETRMKPVRAYNELKRCYML